jgi:ribonuclease BN (tRNA processing enzyme)
MTRRSDSSSSFDHGERWQFYTLRARFAVTRTGDNVSHTVGFVGAVAAAIAVSVGATTPAAPWRRTAPANDSTIARVVLLGTGTPIANPERSGPALAVVVGGMSYLVDAGPGVVRRAVAAAQRDSFTALRAPNLRRIFLTHLHSDHTLGLPDVMLTPAVLHRGGPLTVYGPRGTRAMVDNILAAYGEDIDIRLHAREHGDPASYRMVVHEVAPGVVYRDSNVTVRAFKVPHGTWPNAFGYRFDARGRSIVVSGDTRASNAIVDACNGCDVLVHEVYSKAGFDRLPAPDRLYHSAFHTSAIELGDLAARAKPKLLVLTHILFFGESAEEILSEVRSRYTGPVVMGEDLGVY